MRHTNTDRDHKVFDYKNYILFSYPKIKAKRTKTFWKLPYEK